MRKNILLIPLLVFINILAIGQQAPQSNTQILKPTDAESDKMGKIIAQGKFLDSQQQTIQVQLQLLQKQQAELAQQEQYKSKELTDYRDSVVDNHVNKLKDWKVDDIKHVGFDLTKGDDGAYIYTPDPNPKSTTNTDNTKLPELKEPKLHRPTASPNTKPTIKK